MIILTDAQAKHLANILRSDLDLEDKADELSALSTLEGHGTIQENESKYRDQLFQEDVLIHITKEKYQHYLDNHPDLVNTVVIELANFLRNKYDYSSYNEDIVELIEQRFELFEETKETK